MSDQKTIGVVIAGASGRMGRMLIEAVMADPGMHLAGALDIASSPSVGQDAAAFAGHDSGVVITASVDEALGGQRYSLISHVPRARWRMWRQPALWVSLW